MKEYLNLSNDEIISFIQNKLVNNDKIILYYIGWIDFDNFENWCNDDGGVTGEHLTFFKRIPFERKVQNKNELTVLLKELQNLPVLTSKKENVKFYYDLHIWTKEYYFVLNAYLKKVYVKKKNILERLFPPFIQPEWQKEIDIFDNEIYKNIE